MITTLSIHQENKKLVTIWSTLTYKANIKDREFTMYDTRYFGAPFLAMMITLQTK
jgi:hypothetical protein